MATTKKTLVEDLDDAAGQLLKLIGTEIEVTSEQGVVKMPIALDEQISIFNSVTRYLAVKHRVSPDDDEESGIGSYIEQLKQPNGASGNRRGGRKV